MSTPEPGSATEEQVQPLLEQRSGRLLLGAQGRRQRPLGARRDDQHLLAGSTEVLQPSRLRADVRVALQVFELAPQLVVARLRRGDLVAYLLSLLRDRPVGVDLPADLDRQECAHDQQHDDPGQAAPRRGPPQPCAPRQWSRQVEAGHRRRVYRSAFPLRKAIARDLSTLYAPYRTGVLSSAERMFDTAAPH